MIRDQYDLKIHELSQDRLNLLNSICDDSDLTNYEKVALLDKLPYVSTHAYLGIRTLLTKYCSKIKPLVNNGDIPNWNALQTVEDNFIEFSRYQAVDLLDAYTDIREIQDPVEDDNGVDHYHLMSFSDTPVFFSDEDIAEAIWKYCKDTQQNGFYIDW